MSNLTEWTILSTPVQSSPDDKEFSAGGRKEVEIDLFS